MGADRKPAHLFDRRSRAVVKLPSLSGWSSSLETFNGGEFYAPQNSAQDAVRRAFAEPPDGESIDLGLTALRSLGLAVTGGEALEREHAFDCGRPSAVEQRGITARAATDVKVGSLLLTHPVSCLKQSTLHHAVILIISVDDESVSGLVINKPLDVSLGAAVSDNAKAAVGDALAHYPLYRGGDVSERQLLLLHELEGLEGSTRVAEGLYATSSFTEVRDALEKRSARADLDEIMRGGVSDSGGQGGEGADSAGGDAAAGSPPAGRRVKCVAGFAGWARDQLNAELERNVWFLAEVDDVAALAMMAPPTADVAGYSWLRDAMWSGVLTQLGGEHESLARFPGDHEVVWEHMSDIWTRQSEELHKRIDALDPVERDG